MKISALARKYGTAVLMLAVLLLAATTASAENTVPESCPIKPGQQVLLFGDQMIAPGMYGYVVNTLLDRLYPDSGIVFHSKGRGWATAKNMLPAVQPALEGKTFDWVLISFSHMDAERYDANEFLTVHAPALLAEVRKYHKGKIGWISLTGNEPSPFLNEPGREKQAEKFEEGRKKQESFVGAVQQLCKNEDLLYVPIFEPMAKLLAERSKKNLKVSLTAESIHPNLFGNWLVGGMLVQSLGFKPAPMTMDILPGDVWCDQGRRDPAPAETAKPVKISFDDLFLSLRLVPPSERVVRAVPAPGKIKIDGKPGEWESLPEIVIKPHLNVTMENVPLASKQGYAASLRACHDKDNLYLLFEVSEPDTSNGETFQELIEVFVDARKDRSRSGNVWQRTKGLTQFVFSRDFSGAEPTNAKASANGDKSQGEGLKAAAQLTDTGYTLEAAIPLGNFEQVDIRSEAVPFDWAISFRDQALNLDWQGLMSRSSSTFGYGTLEIGAGN